MTCIEDRRLTGWAFEAATRLNAAEPSFLPFLEGAAPLRRQAIFCCLSGMRLSGWTPLGDMGLDPCGVLARMFMALRSRETIRVVHGRVPDGLLGALRRLGPAPLAHTRYWQLLTAFSRPANRHQSRFIRQTSSTITGVQLEAVFGLDPVLLHRNVVEHFYNAEEIEQANAALRLLRRTSPKITDDVVQSTIRAGRVMDLGRYFWRLFALIEHPLASPPIPADLEDVLLLDTGKGIAAHGKQYRTCIARRTPMVAAGAQAFVVWRCSPGTVAELHRREDGGFGLFKLHGPYNLPPSPSVADEFQSMLGALGIPLLPGGYDPERMLAILRPLGLHDFAWELGFDVFESDNDALRDADEGLEIPLDG